ncbi:MAG: glycoside hydrolase family 2 TIM barrel-domain containing protein [Propioniciclava sp.]
MGRTSQRRAGIPPVRGIPVRGLAPVRRIPTILAVGIGLVAVALGGCTADQPETGPWDGRPDEFAVHRLPATARTIPLLDRDSAVQADETTSPWLLSLNGRWSFRWSPGLADASADFADPAVPVTDWDTVTVPHNWQLDGYGDPDTGDLVYLNEQHPWQGYGRIEPPALPTEGASIGSYRRTIEVPSLWDGRRIILGFQGVKSAFTVWVNGVEVGYSEDSFTPAEFDVTEAVVPGENTVAVRVHRWSDGSWLENQDMIDLSGIFRDVEMYALPGSHVDDHQVVTEVGRDQDATLTATVDLVHTGGAGPVADALEATLYDPEGAEVGRDEVPLRADAAASVELRIPVADAALWSAEDPNLYTLVYELTAQATTVEHVGTRIGIREFGIVDGQMTLNGQPLRITGMNRGEMHPDVGQALTEDTQRADLVAMRRHGITALRTAHYPADPDLYRLADEIGMYVMDEANVETHALRPFPGNAPDWTPAVLDRVESMFARDKNHASVLWWSLGNEAGPGPVFAEAADWLRAHDSTRLVHYQDDSRVADIDGVFYPLHDDLVERAGQTTGRPWIVTEYQHAMGNSLGGIEQDWSVIESNPEMQGGFVWDWADQAIRLPIDGGLAGLPIPEKTPPEQTYFSYGGDWGDYPSDGGFALNGVTLPDRTPQPELADLAAVYAPVQLLEYRDDGSAIRVRNEHLFTDLAAFAVSWRVEVDGSEVSTGTAQASVPPLGTGWVDLTGLTPAPVPAGATPTVTVEFSLAADTTWAEAGYQVAALSFVPAWETTGRTSPITTAGSTQVSEGPDGVTLVRAEALTLGVDTASGAITSLVVDGSELLAAPIRPDFWRAPTQNDRMNGLISTERWLRASRGLAAPGDEAGGIEVTAVSVEESADSGTRITVDGSVRMEESPGYRMVVWVTPEGEVVITARLEASEVPGEIPAVGLALDLAGDLDTLTWLGAGPHETWRDRAAGARFGRWRSAVADQLFGHVVPQATGQHTEVRWATLTRADGSGLLIASAGAPVEVAALPASEAAISTAAHPHEIVTDDVVHVAVDAVQQGLGVSWGATALPEFSVSPGDDHELTVVLSPLRAHEDPAVLARRVWVEPQR